MKNLDLYITLISSTPNWFDFVSLGVTVLSILGAYYIAESVYHRERSDKKIEDLSLQYSEYELFKNNLTSLQEPIKSQINAINDYLDNQDFKMVFYPEIQVDFLQFISIKEIYKKFGFKEKEKIALINKVMTSLYSLYDFRESLRGEVRTYIQKYNSLEQKFYSYRQLLYTKFFALCNTRSTKINFKGGVKSWEFESNDKFMIEYSNLNLNTFKDTDVMIDNNLISRENLVEKFVEPLSKIAANYIPEDVSAIEIFEISSEVLLAYNDMDYITKKHFEVLEGYKKSLETVLNKMEDFLKL